MGKILFLISTFLITACGKQDKVDSWKAPQVYWLRSTEILPTSSALTPYDAIYFAEESYSRAEDLQANTWAYHIESKVSCIINNKVYKEEDHFYKNNVTIKEILPIVALETPHSSCTLHLTLKNSNGSTKTYIFENKKIEVSKFKYDFDIKKAISENDLTKTYLNGHSKNDRVILKCDGFTSQMTAKDTEAISFDQLFIGKDTLYKGIKATEYKPHQKCYISASNISRKFVSNLFEVRFHKLQPQYSYNIYNGPRSNRQGNRLFLYTLNVYNPHPVPISIALHKPAMMVPLSVAVTTGNKEFGDHTSYRMTIEQARYTTSGKAKLIDKGNNSVIYLLPGDDFIMQAYVDKECGSRACYSNKAQDEHLPLYNLEYNYRSLNEIQAAEVIKVLDRLSSN